MFESDYNRHFSYLPHNTILYSNNLINPVGALDTPDDLILKYSSTRINTVCVCLLSHLDRNSVLYHANSRVVVCTHPVSSIRSMYYGYAMGYHFKSDIPLGVTSLLSCLIPNHLSF